MSVSASSANEDNAKTAMDNMYRWTRHVYDASRKFFLLGRDHLIENLNPQKNETVLEVGCGTARNIIKMATRYPDASFIGIDASDEMLKTANKSLLKNKLWDKIVLKQAFAQTMNPQTLFGLDKQPTKLVYSYALSIIPPWKESIDHGLSLLPSGGEMHIVDFGGQEELPGWFRTILFTWLKLFHVYYKPEVLEHLKNLEKSGAGKLSLTHLNKGYAYYAVFKKK